MWNRAYRIFLFCCFLTVFVSLNAEEENQYLEWKSVPEAGGYMVEIKDSHGRITREKTKNTKYEVNLSPGVYEHRIGVLNKFGRVSVFSDWISFEVVLSRAPVVEPDSNLRLLREKLGSHLVVKGDNFTEAMNVTLLLPSGETIKPEYEFVSAKEIRIKTEGLDLKNGSYTLSLENPRNKKTAKKGFLVLAESETQLAEIVKQAEKENRDSGSFMHWKPALQSSVLPGWGQNTQEKTYKSWIFPILIAGAIAYSSQQYSEYNSSLGALDDSKNLNRALLLLDNPAFLPFATYNYLQVESNYSHATAEYNQFNLSLGILAFLYLLNVSDAAFVGPSSSKTSLSADEPKVVPYLKTGTSDLRVGPRSGQEIIFPSSIEFGLKFFF
ncbi:hypothetical protein EHQ12_09165 [Leptospira gomenensis]|uniref:Uncharacterized protein n=1 Tax=Leptospira gomenensis TaxID=2484974 RepID=A0A5F1YFM6_9LEPT|nr:DUF5683 domain-containing protein [Leptospira gomenensis]TGK37513.1 hypothetical protein EHQ17_02890 [Leptospira gomenensis]TGK39481.1 hypothetical protein EHQ12_09165 [Leptospira gomenensis]TGK43097.1 hypothetical protein EHQ07_13185 [Leptospira gomenensis]TGK55074.1 hypothetical protein EHQ13_18025 [Leptospira gomenensis]